MAEFNTHGGYFAPAGYMKVNAGGSHEENPNGGVQIGVDQQGVPNMLEEGEPVYKDFVFSDNIVADVKFLIEAGLPKHYAGKLYSEICDALFAEAEERPNDPISKNGLDAMLGRLAEAQEAQKAAEEEAALMEELKNMSPEELAAIEQMMAQEAQAQEQPMIPEEQMQPEMAMMPEEQMPMETAQPVMALGGPMNSFAMGGDEDDPIRTEVAKWYEANRDKSFVEKAGEAIGHFFNGPETWTAPNGNEYPVIASNGLIGFLSGAGMANAAKVKEARALLNELGSSASKELRMAVEGLEKWMPELEKVKKVDRGLFAGSGSVAKQNVDSYSKMLNDAMKAYNGKGKAAKSAAKAIKQEVSSEIKKDAKALKDKNWIQRNWKWAVPTGAIFLSDGILESTPTGGIVTNGINLLNNRSYSGEDIEPYDLSTAVPYRGYALGGAVNRFDWGDFMQRLNAYSVSQNPGGTSGRYRIDTQFPLGRFKDIRALENDPGYQAFTDFVINNSNNPDVLAYLHALDNGTYANVPKLFTGDTLNKGWEELYRTRRTDGLGGIYHFYDENIPYPGYVQPALNNDISWAGVLNPMELSVSPRTTQTVSVSSPGQPQDPANIIWENGLIPGITTTSGINAGRFTIPYGAVRMANEVAASLNPQSTVASTATPTEVAENEDGVVVDDGRNGRPSVLSTLPRYAGAVGSGLLALNTLLQDPDHYDYAPIRPALPTGRILLQDQRYMPIDQNMVTNQIQANNAANTRALLNSGAGPSTGALLASADYTGGLNLGNAMTNVWQANNQERNRVIAANNQNAATRAQFYRDLDSQRAQILNNMAMYNNQNALRVAILNNQAEQDKYNAFAQNLGNSLKALSGIGQENFAMNQANTNSALGWYVGPDGRAYYRGPNWSNCGGFIKKIKK